MISKRIRGAKQIDKWHAKDRRWIADLVLEPNEIEKRWPIHFASSVDDLGEVRVAFIEVGSGNEVLLAKYANPYLDGTNVWIPAEAKEPKAYLSALKDALQLSGRDFRKVSPDLNGH